MHRPFAFGIAAVLAVFVGVVVYARATPEHAPMHGGQHMMRVVDTRQAVSFPSNLREHTLASMRDHLWTLGQIQAALANSEFGRASQLAEHRLGLSSLQLHGASEVAPYMPKGMAELGMQMHRAASKFAIAASTAGATGNVRPALAALARVTSRCVACHSAYRLR